MRVSRFMTVAVSTMLLTAAVPAVATAQTASSALRQTQAAAALTDTDGDGLPDIWETDGYDADGDGKADVDLKKMGADPNKKDIFVETDYLTDQFPGTAVYDKIVTAFQNMAVSNPDGTTGIKIHLDAGTAGGTTYDLGGGGEIKNVTKVTDIDTVKDAKAKNMASARVPIFHYMWWVDKYGTGSSSGQATSPGDTLLVSMGSTYWAKATNDEKASTFVHELGHNLGLDHGGSDDVNNKPNYLSVMNYRFQMSGVPLTAGGNYYGFSKAAGIDLDESALDESSGIGAAGTGYKTTFVNGKDKAITVDAGGAIDWNGNGKIDKDPVSVNINREDSNDSDETLSTLTGYDDIANLKFKVGAIGIQQSKKAPRNAPVKEQVSTNDLTFEQYLRLKG